MLSRRAVRDVRSSRMAQEWRESELERESLLESIRGALLEIFTSHNEVPFIAMHRKQVAFPG
jgi:transcriptional accessory protein Tex/SPT6